MEKIALQSLRLGDAAIADGTREMFYRSANTILSSLGEKGYLLRPGYYDFSTYFNSFSLRKWEAGSEAERFSLELKARGDFQLDMMGHFQDHDGDIHKEWLGSYAFSLKEPEQISIDIPAGIASEVIAFQLTVTRPTTLYGGHYVAELPEALVQQPKIGIVLQRETDDDSHKAERFLKRCVLEDRALGAYFTMAEPNKPVPGLTHLLYLKNDAFFSRESFRRLAAMLITQNRDARTLEILGAELDLRARNLLTATSAEDGEMVYDLNRWDDVIRAESSTVEPSEYNGFRCVPVKTAVGKARRVILNGVCCWHDPSAQPETETPAEDGKIVLQKILVDAAAIWDGTQDMYYRSEAKIVRGEDGVFRLPAAYYDFSTYFNSFSLGKWKKYTNGENWTLELDVQGSFSLDLMGHYVDAVGNIHKEWLGSYTYDLRRRQRVSVPIPEEASSIVVAFQITASAECRFYDGFYAAEAQPEHIRDPFITLATTTFKKEDYIRKNIHILRNTLFSDPDLAPHFSWKIIDNGSTLDPEEWNTDYLEVIPNRNVGGSGGFCRGMIEALSQERRPTHVLLMDDDVYFMAESFRRVCKLLTLLKPEYDDYYISGAMLEINQRNIQHEDVGMFRLSGEHGPTKPRYDLNLWDSPIRNEVPLPEDPHQYSGWWYCCVPTTIAREDNLPLPFFIRGDDVEYSIRNHAKFITMNGICIWHEGFGTKFSGSMELYQVHRNDLILQTTNEHIADVKVIERMQNLFWEEIFKFNYKGCNLLLDAVEDFLKGPEFIKSLDGEACMKAQKAKDNQLKPITDEVRRHINYETLYHSAPLTGFSLKWYGHFVNGQKLPEFLCGKKVTVIPYGWGYSQERLHNAGTVYAVDPHNDLYVEFKRDRKQFRETTARYEALMARFRAEYDSVAEAYRRDEKEMESKDFWIRYLNS